MIRHAFALATILSIITCPACTPVAHPPPSDRGLATILVASDLNRPVDAVAAPGDVNRLFIVEQPGVIRILDLMTHELLADAFLDIETRVSDGYTGNGEQGLLSLAFHPHYFTAGDADQGHFLVHYTDVDGNTAIERYGVTDDPNVADAASALRLLSVDQPFANHNGGTIAFGPRDAYLYIALGDGGSANDPANRAQDTGTLLGKMLRINIDNASADAPYTIPPDNPFAASGGRPEIWALGLRNPWRWSFDRDTGDLYVADVGQDAREEVDFAPAGAAGGRNYGWRCLEGTRCTGLSGCECDDPALIAPVYEYGHDLAGGFSITGGYVYRGLSIPELAGHYLFADFLTARIWSLRMIGNAAADITDRTDDLNPPDIGDPIARIASFAQDAGGELYIIDRGPAASTGRLFRIIAE
ncbi:MAG: glucose dehydrogenase [Phycisphaerales bacterium]|nr:glucose dehydrogenase [Phycisphaerales bacterium]